MAYNNRDWDRGKDSWNEGAAWNGQEAYSHGRGYEEEAYGEAKRRKFNGGVRSLVSVCHRFSHFFRAIKVIPTNSPTTMVVATMPATPMFSPTMIIIKNGVSNEEGHFRRSARSKLQSPVLMSFSLVWTQTSPRPMSVDIPTLDHALPND